MKPAPYHLLSYADKRRHAPKGGRAHPGRAPARVVQPPEFVCLECRARITHKDAAGHAARCTGKPVP